MGNEKGGIPLRPRASGTCASVETNVNIIAQDSIKKFSCGAFFAELSPPCLNSWHRVLDKAH